MSPFPNMWRVGLTFDLPFDLLLGQSLKLLRQSVLELSVAQGMGNQHDLWLDLWPTDLNINRGHLLILDNLPTTFEACRTKHCWVISCTRYGQSIWPLTLDLLTWISIGIIYLSWTIYLPSLKLVGQSIVELSVAQGIRDQHDLWPWGLTYWPEYR